MTILRQLYQCSILNISPELFFLPADGSAAPLAATASEAGAADEAEEGADGPSGAGGAAAAAGGQDLLVGHRSVPVRQSKAYKQLVNPPFNDPAVVPHPTQAAGYLLLLPAGCAHMHCAQPRVV